MGESREHQSYVICDLRSEWRRRPYVTFWRPKNANYAYPLSWAGDYSKETVDEHAAYYTETENSELVRFAVTREVALSISENPRPGDIDGDAGPVVKQTADNIRILREAAYIPDKLKHGDY